MGDCKYYKYQKYVSRDNGQTWSPMNEYQKGGLYETCSEDCGYAPSYRWVHSYFDCDNELQDLNEILKKQASHDGGETWTDVSPLETMTMLYEADSIYCGFEMPNMTGVKYLIQTDNGTYSGECCDGTCECVRYSGDTNGATGDRWRIFVGDCVNEIGNCPIGGNYNSYYLPNTLKIIDDEAFYNRNIIKIRMPNSVQYIGDDAFTPSSLTSTACRGFNIPNNLRFVGRRAFSGCPIFNNSEVYFPNIRVIGESAFDNVITSRQTLDTLRLGIHLWSIGTNAFRTDGKINNLIFENLVYPSISYYASNHNCTNWFEDLYDDLYSGITCPCLSSPCSDYLGLPDEENKFGIVGSEINHIYVPKHSINKYLNKWLNDYHGNNEFSYFGQYSEDLGTYLPIITELEEEPEFINLRKLAIAYDTFDEWYPLYSKGGTNITKPLYDVYTTKSTTDSGSNKNRGIKTLEVLEGTTSIGTSGISSNTLNTVILPSTLDFINGASFYGCHYIKKVYSYATTPPELGVTHDIETAFWQFNPPTVYVPEELVGVYRSNRYWSGFTISAINESDFYIEKWETVQNDYICEGSIKYSKERKYTGASLTQYSCNEWTPTDEYRRGHILQANSTDCGFVVESEYKYIGNCLNGNNIKVPLKLNEQINRNNAIHLSGSEILGTCHGSGATRSCEGEHLSGLTIGNCVNFIDKYTFAKFDLPSRVVIPDNVLTIEERAFSACTSLETVDIGRNITFIGNQVFRDCSNLTTVIIRATVPPSLTPNIPFGNTPIENGTGYIYVPCESVETYKAASGWSSYASRIHGIQPCYEPIYRTTSSSTYCTGYDKYVDVYSQVSYNNGSTWQTTATTSTLVEPNSIDCGYMPSPTGETKWIAKYQSGFTESETTTSPIRIKSALCSAIPVHYIGNHEIPSCLDCGGIGASGRNYFIREVKIGDCVDLKIADGAFMGDWYELLTSVTISNTVKRIGFNAFQGCKRLNNITIPNSVTRIDGNAFNGCDSFTNIVIPDSVTTVGPYEEQGEPTTEGIFAYCSGLTSCTLSRSMTNIPPSMFRGCKSLTSVGGSGSGASVEIPSNITKISEEAFFQCDGITSVTIPNTVSELGGSVFMNCDNLRNVSLPNSITDISDYTFNACSSLTNIIIPDSVTSIGIEAFYGCSSLSSVTINAVTPPKLGSDAFYGSTCTIYVPAASVDAYKTARRWSYYASRIQPIPNS